MPALTGPHGSIEYTRDALGYPSIRARDFLDGTWARGWFHARDRLTSIQIVLALARGRALSLLGDVPLARAIDRAMHLHRLDGELPRQVAAMSPPARAMVDTYCAGFDAGAKARGWPLLLRLVGIKPQPFGPAEAVLLYRFIVYFGLTSMVEWAETILAELVAGGASADVLRLLGGDAAGDEELRSLVRLRWPDELASIGLAAAGASNGIAVAAARSKNGGALLIGDPHLEVARLPPALYASHIEHQDGSYLQGVFIPGFAWPSFGRTAKVAWTYTYGHGRSIDVRTARCRRGEAWDGAAWRPLVRRAVEVRVKKKPNETWVYWDAPFGTILGDAAGDEEQLLPCFHWPGLHETTGDFECARATIDATNVDELAAAQRRMCAASLHAILADDSGRVGQVLTGRVATPPPGSGGLLPLPVEGSAPFSESARPVLLDPQDGFVVSANERRNGPSGELWVPLPEPRYRHQRLSALLAAADRVDTGDLVRFVCDRVDVGARRLLAAWAPLMPDDERARKLVSWSSAQGGDGHFDEMALFIALHRETCRALMERRIGGARANRFVDELVGVLLFQHPLDDALALERPQLLAPDELRELLSIAWPRALAAVAGDADARLPVVTRARNILLGGNPVAALLGLDSARIANPGGPNTPNQSRVVRAAGQRMVFGAAGRYVADLSRPGGWYCIPGGASESRFGPGYGLGLPAWAAGRFAPLGPVTGDAPDLPAAAP